MALTRAQLLMSNQSQGAVLAGQPVAVTAGSGITIDPNTGVISVNASTISGVMKLNNGSAYNAYQWPASPGTDGQFLQTNGAGLVDWADVQGFAVVTVQSGAPSPADVGELWFDCATGTLNVYQNCVGTPSPNWFNVAQPGFPVLPGNTSASPAFATGTGTQIDPYDCSVTSVGAGTTVQILNTVTVTTLAPFQFVPIVDLNAVINGGRFSFTNNYADASGNLTFDIVFTDLPTSPTGTPFTALIKIGYGSAYVESRVNIVAPLAVSGGTVTGPAYSNQQLTYVPGVASGGSTPYGPLTYQWYADGVAIGGATGLTYTVTAGNVGKVITATTSVTDASGQTATGTSNSIGPIVADPGTLTVVPGSIAPTTGVVVGDTLNYTAGSFSLGIPPVTASWVWQRAGTNITGTANATSYQLVTADAGQAITVRYSATDSSTPTADTASASTNAVTPTAPFPGGVWGPVPANGMNTNPGGISGTYSGTGTTITVTGCIEASVNGQPYATGSQPIASGQTLAIRWRSTPACGDANTNTTMNGTVSDGTYTNSYTLQINRVPVAIGDITDTNVALGATVSKGITPAISGLNSVAYVTAGSGSTGTNIGVSLVAGGPFTPIPATGSTTFPISNTQTLYVEQTVGGAINTAPGYTAVVKVGDADGVLADEFTYFAQTVSSAVFPGLTFTPAGGPNAANETVSNVTGGGLLGTLNGVANSNSWPTGLGTTLSSPVSGANPTMKFQKNGAGGFVTSGLSVVPTDILNLAWNEAYLATVADGGTANGSITGTVGAATYTNTFSMSVKRDAVWSIGTPVINAALNSSHSTAILLPNDYNVPVTVTFNNPTSGTSPLPMIAGTISYAIDSNPTVSVTLGTTTATLNPGETLQVFGDVGGANNQAYGVKIKIGTSAAQDWLVTTTAVTPSVQTPIIGPPSNNSVNQGTPTGITISGDSYVPLNGAGAQASSTWEVYKGSYPLTSTNTISGVTQNTLGSWTLQAGAGFTTFNQALMWANGNWYAGGGSGSLRVSSNNGASWSNLTSNVTNAITRNGLAYGSGIYGASDGGFSMSFSTDGTTFTAGTLPGGVTGRLFNVSGKLVATNQSGATTANPATIYISNGTVGSWTTKTITFGATIQTASLTLGSDGGNTWICAASQSGGANLRVARSTDGGANWTEVFSGNAGGADPASVAYNAGKWIITGDGATFWTSSDGTSWTPGSNYWTTNNVNTTAITSGGLFYVIGPSSTDPTKRVGTSVDGLTWTYSSAPVAFNILAASPTGTLLANEAASPANVYVASQPNTTLTIANCQTDGFLAGDTVVSGSGAAAGPATILSLDNTQVTVTSSTGWVNTNTQTLKRDPASYTAVTGSPFTVSTGTLTSLTIAKPPLEANTKYWARVLYTSTLPVSSNYSSWSNFTTGSLLNNFSTFATLTLPGSFQGSSYPKWLVNGSDLIIYGNTDGSSNTAGWAFITSDNGATWSSVTLPNTGQALHFDGTDWWCAGAVNSFGGSQIWKLSGSTLTTAGWTFSKPILNYTSDITSDAGAIIVTGGALNSLTDTPIYYTTNGGTTWTTSVVTAAGGAAGYAIRKLGGSFRLFTSNNILSNASYSAGGSWTSNAGGLGAAIMPNQIGGPGQLTNGSWLVGAYFSGATVNGYVTSPDLTTWTGVTNQPASGLGNLVTEPMTDGTQSIVVTTANASVYTSLTNGAPWTLKGTPTSFSAYHTIFYNGAVWMAPAGGNTVVKTTN